MNHNHQLHHRLHGRYICIFNSKARRLQQTHRWCMIMELPQAQRCRLAQDRRGQNCSSSVRPELEEKPGRRPCPSRFSKWLEAPKRSKKLKIDRLVYPIHSNQNTQTWPFSAQSATQVLLGGEKTMASRHGCLAAPSNVPGILRASGIPSICMYGNPNKNRKTWFPPL